MKPPKKSVFCRLKCSSVVLDDIFKLEFEWPASGQSGIPPLKAGQFFMVKPGRSAVFLARPLSISGWDKSGNDSNIIVVSFLVVRRGKGTSEFSGMNCGEEAELIGPLGNAWSDFLPPAEVDGQKPIALVGGGVGFAPLGALLHEESGYRFHLYSGLRRGFRNEAERGKFLGASVTRAGKIVIAAEDGVNGLKGRIPDFLEPEHYAAVCACGPEAMLKAVAAKCRTASVPCFISMERRMACGAGACLGCTVQTVNGNRRCCADGPVFNAQDVIFDD